MTAIAVTALPPPESVPPAAGLAGRSLRALKWNYLGTLSKVLSQLVIGIVLARLLGPEPFGLVAIAWLVLGLGNLVADFGLAAALIQRAEINEDDIRYVFTLQLLTGAMLTALMFFLAPLLAGFYHRPDVEPVLQWMGLCFLIQASGQTATALLRRGLDHRRVQTCQVASYLIGYLLLGIPLAYAGAGVWALVAAQICQASLYAVSAYLGVRHALRPLLRGQRTGIFSFGSKVTASNLTSWGIINLDSAIVGRMLGVVELGLYNRAMTLVASPMFAAVSSLQGVLFPLFSRLQGQMDQLRLTYLGTICLLSLVLVPVFFAVAAIPGTTVLAIYGPGWESAIALITPLALAMPVNAVMGMGGPLMLGMGRAGFEAGLQLVGVLALVAATVVAAGHSLEAVAWAVLIVYVLRAILVTRLALGLIATSGMAVARALAGSLILGLIAAGTAWLVNHLSETAIPLAGLRLVVDLGAAGVVVFLVLAILGRRLLCGEARGLLRRAEASLPGPLSGLVRHWSAP